MLSIVKRRDSLGLLQHSDTEERFTKSTEELHALLQIAMGGMVAEERWFDEVSTGPASDLAAATAMGAQMIGACGMGNSLISVAAAGNGYLDGNLVDKVLGDRAARAELDALLMGSCDSAKAIVDSHPEVVEALRDALLERDELVGSEITEVIEAALEGSEVRHHRRAAPPGRARSRPAAGLPGLSRGRPQGGARRSRLRAGRPGCAARISRSVPAVGLAGPPAPPSRWSAVSGPPRRQ